MCCRTDIICWSGDLDLKEFLFVLSYREALLNNKGGNGTVQKFYASFVGERLCTSRRCKHHLVVGWEEPDVLG